LAWVFCPGFFITIFERTVIQPYKQLKVKQMKHLLAKFKVSSVTDYGNNNHETKMSPVVSGSDENKSFSLYTPNGDFRIMVNNPDLIGFFVAGDEHYFKIWNAKNGIIDDHVHVDKPFYEHPEYSELLDKFKEALKLLNYSSAVMRHPGHYPNEGNTKTAVNMFVDKHGDIVRREAFPAPIK
jgi:hypothetical protein